MSRIVLALAILMAVLGLAHPATAVTNPIYPNKCGASATNSGTTVAALACVLNNVVSGNTVVIEASTQSTSDSVTSSGGETVTCPAGAVGLFVAGSIRTRVCYSVLGSSHATLTITVTATGGTAQAHGLIAQELQGLGAVDTPSASGANAQSVSTTTAANNEIIFASCRAFANEISPGTSFTQLGYVNPVTEGGGTQDERTFSETRIVASASTTTSACSFVNDVASTVIAALAFQYTGVAAPTVGNVQFCELNITGSSNGSDRCAIHNTTSGNKIIIGIVMASNGTAFTVGATSCTETCTFPANAQTTATVYGGLNVVLALGYADTTSSHSTFSVTANKIGGSASTETRFIWMEEISGMNSGADTPSAANAVATTVNYTTAANNEYTICYAVDNNANPMSPGNSFASLGQMSGTLATVQQGLFMSKTTVSAGSNTCSYSMTGSTQPLIAALAFGLPATGSNTPAHSVIIDFHPRSTPFKRLPWIDRRAKLRIITI